MFSEFKKYFQNHVNQLFTNHKFLFTVDIDKDALWDLYLDSFPPGTNQLYRKRREFDCSCCRHFIKLFGNVVAIENNNIITIWDFNSHSPKYQPVIDSLSLFIKTSDISDVFVTKDSTIGVDKNHQMLENSTVHTWEHFSIRLPLTHTYSGVDTVPTVRGMFKTNKQVLERSMTEISSDAIDTVLDLISQNALYRGAEWKPQLETFKTIHSEYHTLPSTSSETSNYLWSKSVEAGPSISKIKNHSIGTLLIDLSENTDLETALKRYESIMAPTNYKRPKAIYTPKMIEQAKQTITELGYLESLGRRFATADDITINNIIFKNIIKRPQDVFDELSNSSISKPKNFRSIDTISIDQFISEIAPKSKHIDLYLENRHRTNLMSIISPVVKTSASMFKWSNGFSWAYSGNITDSMKERVKAAGGKTDGPLRFSIQWNDEDHNPNDFDAHCVEPNGNHIFFSNKYPQIHASTARLDVDIINPTIGVPAVENITWADIDKMQKGVYEFYVHNFNYKGGTSGFKAEIEYNGQVFSYEYTKPLSQNETVRVATIDFNRSTGIRFLYSLPPSVSSKRVWGLQTNNFHPVNLITLSPNFWGCQSGNKHYFFILANCKNPDTPNGFFNEFLKEDLLKHKRVFEALGAKMKVNQSDDQLSGLGFSSTKHDSVVCRVVGETTRILQITF